MENILKEVKKSFGLLDLKKNWDGIGASPMDRKIYIKALIFLFNHLIDIDVIIAAIAFAF